MLRSPLRAKTICGRCLQALQASRRKASTDVAKFKPARTRFAPSPTGNLHLGSLRTALFNYLWARRTGGQFILRIEDTDTKRTIPGAEQKILEDLRWAGLQWDEGPEVGGPYGPYRQSERVQGIEEEKGNIYKQHAERLIKSGHAYRCFCTPQELAMRSQGRNSQGLTSEYDGKCSHLAPEQSEDWAQSRPFVVRMKDDRPSGGWNDMVFGQQGREVSASNKPKGARRVPRNDHVVLKSDGWPTYHLASVVDDWHMKITHVIRGVEWLKSTPKHVALYKAFGWDMPEFAHVGLLRDASQSKLSKRDLKFDLTEIKQNILPEALMNFLVLLGWKQNPDDPEVSQLYSMSKLEDVFDLNLNKTNPIVAFEKLDYLQGQHLHRKCQSDTTFRESIVSRFQTAVEQIYLEDDLQTVGIYSEKQLRARVVAFLDVQHAVDPEKWAVKHEYVFSNRRTMERLPVQLTKSNKAVLTLSRDRDFSEHKMRKVVLSSFLNDFSNDVNWSQNSLMRWIDSVVATILEECTASQTTELELTDRSVKAAVNTYLRQWIAWGQQGRGIVDIMYALGFDVCLSRLQNVQSVQLQEEHSMNGPPKVDSQVTETSQKVHAVPAVS